MNLLFKTTHFLLAGLLNAYVPSSADLPVPAKALVGHVQVLQALKERFAADIQKIEPKRTNKTPTLTYIQKAKEGKIVGHFWNPDEPSGENVTCTDMINYYSKKYKKVVDQIIERERQHCDSYYVFYHGQRASFRIFQDF